MQKIEKTDRINGLWAEALAWTSAFVEAGCPERMVNDSGYFEWDKLALVTKILLTREEFPGPLHLLWAKVHKEFQVAFTSRIKKTASEKERDIAGLYIDNVLSEMVVKEKVTTWDISKGHFNGYFGHYVHRWKVPDFFKYLQKNNPVEYVDIESIGAIGKDAVSAEENSQRFLELFSLLLTLDQEKTGKSIARKNPHRLLFFLHGSMFYLRNSNIGWQDFYGDQYKHILGKLYNDIYQAGPRLKMKENLDTFDNFVLSKTAGEIYHRDYEEDVELRKHTGTDLPVKEIKIYTFFLRYYEKNPVEYNITGIVGLLSRWRNEIKTTAYTLFKNHQVRHRYYDEQDADT